MYTMRIYAEKTIHQKRIEDCLREYLPNQLIFTYHKDLDGCLAVTLEFPGEYSYIDRLAHDVAKEIKKLFYQAHVMTTCNGFSEKNRSVYAHVGAGNQTTYALIVTRRVD